ncbi:hypothetical protein CERSUDRAFT_88931 [Gelatoporia subvermispora B]|uniref:Uncharacterized protein n=1 Tax=Ceriporiopsis subvermispora (strain B) TaxID=914234 RepID=M2R014_CERS8|nr:hypothetical protein CERSUDRAFT_88931 [Gelatoporia subvermispora B]
MVDLTSGSAPPSSSPVHRHHEPFSPSTPPIYVRNVPLSVPGGRTGGGYSGPPAVSESTKPHRRLQPDRISNHFQYICACS